MPATVVSGLGEVHPVRRSGRAVEDLVLESIRVALNDAGLLPGDIGAVVTESSLTPRMAPIDRIAPAAGLNNLTLCLQSTPVGAGILAAVGTAFDVVSNGKVDHCLVYFGVDWGTSPAGPAEYHEKMPAKKLAEIPAGLAGPPLYFAMAAKRYQYLHGLADAELQELLRSVVDSTLFNASHHPHAQNRRMLDREQYLAKPMIAEPLRSCDCSLLSDGAVALVVSRAGLAGRRSPAVTLAAWNYDQDPIPDMDFYSQSPWLPALPAASRSASRAFVAAGMTPGEVSVYQLYDCFSIAVPLQLEAIGACAPGAARHLCADGALRFDGPRPTNTHGGLLGHGYLLGAGHVAEAIWQLRGEAGARQVPKARTAFVGAGPGRQYTSLIFKRLDGETQA